MSNVMRVGRGYGDFGNLSKNYDKMRKGFPDETITYIFQRIGKEEPYILDIGCGTGIATKLLREKGAEVVGTDVDPEMIRQAMTDNQHRIEYRVAPAEAQPFTDNRFDAVTAFSSFHWFANEEAADEIKRVIKPGGFFFAINKKEIGNFKKRNKEILRQFIKRELPDIKNKYNPWQILDENGFRSVEEKIFPVTEYFNLEEAVGYIQTMSLWNLVPEDKKDRALERLAEHFGKIMKDEKVERQLEIVVVSGVGT